MPCERRCVEGVAVGSVSGPASAAGDLSAVGGKAAVLLRNNVMNNTQRVWFRFTMQLSGVVLRASVTVRHGCLYDDDARGAG